MLEDKRLINLPSHAKKALKGNGSGGVDGFIQANTLTKSKSMPKRWTSHVRDFNKGKAVVWEGNIINPKKLDLSRVSIKSITTLTPKNY